MEVSRSTELHELGQTIWFNWCSDSQRMEILIMSCACVAGDALEAALACALQARSAPSSPTPGCSSTTLSVTLSEEEEEEAAWLEERETSSCKRRC